MHPSIHPFIFPIIHLFTHSSLHPSIQLLAWARNTAIYWWFWNGHDVYGPALRMPTVYFEGEVTNDLVTKIRKRNDSFQGEKQGKSRMYYKGTYCGLEKYNLWNKWQLTSWRGMGTVLQAEGTAFAEALRWWGTQPYFERNRLVLLQYRAFPLWGWNCRQGHRRP